MSIRSLVIRLLSKCGRALTVTVQDRLTTLECKLNDLAETHTALLQGSIHVIESLQKLQQRLENEVVQQVYIEANDYNLANPEIGLMSYLYSYLPTRRAIDVGAHVGDVSEALLNAGYEVYAFEPSPTVYKRLIGRLGNRADFRPFEFALASVDGEMPLHSAIDMTGSNTYGDATVFSSLVSHGMPNGLQFKESTNVRVRTLESVHRAGLVPDDIGIVKIDTEGFDLEVIRGMGVHRYPVVAAEYWDGEMPFGRSGLLYTLSGLVTEMRSRGYFWHIVLWRIWDGNQIGYYCNYDRSLPNSLGNVFFFKEYDLFVVAQKWCSAVLPRIYFKPSLAAVMESRGSSGDGGTRTLL